jgi:hypothetical protein
MSRSGPVPGPAPGSSTFGHVPMMVDCAQFLEEFCDFRDGLLEASRREAFEDHLRECGACARYERVVENGTRLLQSLPPVEPSEDFQARLQQRIRLEDAAARTAPRSSEVPLSLAAAIALAIAATAWAPLGRPRPVVVELPPVTANAPHRSETLGSLFRPGPLLLPASPAAFRPAPMVNQVFFEYSPIRSYISNLADIPPR